MNAMPYPPRLIEFLSELLIAHRVQLIRIHDSLEIITVELSTHQVTNIMSQAQTSDLPQICNILSESIKWMKNSRVQHFKRNAVRTLLFERSEGAAPLLD
jgi:hypothetical protein